MSESAGSGIDEPRSRGNFHAAATRPTGPSWHDLLLGKARAQAAETAAGGTDRLAPRRGPFSRLAEARSLRWAEAVDSTAGDPAQLQPRREAVGPPPPRLRRKRVPVSPCRIGWTSARRSGVRWQPASGLPGRVEGIAQTEAAAHPHRCGQLNRASRLAARRPSTLRRMNSASGAPSAQAVPAGECLCMHPASDWVPDNLPGFAAGPCTGKTRMPCNRKPDSYFARPLLTSRTGINRTAERHRRSEGLILLHPALSGSPVTTANGMALSEIEAKQL